MPSIDQNSDALSSSPKTSVHWPTLIYFGVMTIILSLFSFEVIPLQFIQKQVLHFSPSQVSHFTFIAGMPFYFAFLAGTVRDRWKPFGMGDRAIFMIFGPLTAACYFYIGHGEMNYFRLLIGLIAARCTFRMIAAAQHGLMSEIGKLAGLAGTLSSIFNVVNVLIAALGIFLGGLFEKDFKYSTIFDLISVLCLSLVLFGFWQPRMIGKVEKADVSAKSHLIEDLNGMLKCKPLWIALLINLMWNFAPGANTALLYYLTDKVHLNSVQYGTAVAVQTIAFLPMMVAYGFLCRKFSLRKQLFWFAIVAIPQWIFFPFIHSYALTIAVMAFVGLTGGGLTAAIFDLTLRVTPKRFEGTTMLIVGAGSALIVNGGDIVGSWLYERGGFIINAIAITIVYSLIVPVLFLVPRAYTDEKELEPIEVAA